MRITIWLLSLSFVVLSPSTAHASDVKVTILSIPAGATVFTTQPDGTEKAWGGSPVRLKWQLPKRWTECFTTESVKVRWISGVEASVAGVEVCPRNGTNQDFLFQRPNDLPRIELDVQYAIALMQSAAAAAAAAQRADDALAADIARAFQRPQPKICTSNVIGNQIFTYCY